MFFDFHHYIDLSYSYGFVDKKTEPVEPVKTPCYLDSHFHIPIEFLASEEKHELSSIVANDLELPTTPDHPSMFTYLFDVSGHLFAQEVLPKYEKYFTSHVPFLQDSQLVIQHTDQVFPLKPCPVSCETIKQYWTNVKYAPGFLEKYGYLEWSILEEYNKSSIVLQSICLANMLSPLSSFIVPFLFFIVPFIILKIQGIPITFSVYLSVLEDITRHHIIGKALNGLQSMQFDKLLYLAGMLFLYVFQMYQNTVQCIRFYHNIETINQELCDWKEYLAYSIETMKKFLTVNRAVKTYEPFCQEIQAHLNTLEELYLLLEPVCPFQCSLYKITEIGYMLRCYYEMHTDESYDKSICFSMGFDGYIHLMKGVRDNLTNHKIHCAHYSTIDTETVNKNSTDDTTEKEDLEPEPEPEPDTFITNQYYPPLKTQVSVVKNNANLDSNMVITGPNASGKTTFLKTTALNVIFAQQLGVGFFDTCRITPYTHIHSYLNIPDTSGRDSLFQAESRRCKEILDSIAVHSNNKHFCIFDELYSGTNPEEATKAAYAFMKYISEQSNVKLILTTHYISICDKWKDENIQNYQMEVIEKKDTIEYTYKITKGVSNVHGAVHILEQMNYPISILNSLKQCTVKMDDILDENV